MIYRLQETTSTNDEAQASRYVHGDVIWAERQTAGRGQRGHTWLSPEGENLLFTVVLCPTFLPVGKQFYLSEAVALALVDTFCSYRIDTRIKWTNDIYVANRKLVGILIEHNLQGEHLSRTRVGVGINVCQQHFDPSLPNPTSMRVETGLSYDRQEVLHRFLEQLARRYALLEQGDYATLTADYQAHLYRLHQVQRFRLADGTEFDGIIRGVADSGALQVEHPNAEVGSYLFKEIEFVIKKSSLTSGM
jgi:BirA family biotin operon repressor/biotin-[acetyl-CoA-carboxylase] ligase